MMCLTLSNIAIITVKVVEYCCIIHDISKSEAIYLLENSVLDGRGYDKMHFKEINIKNRSYNYYFENLIRAKKLETKHFLINDKNYKDLVIYFTIYVHNKSIKMLGLHNHELTGKTEEHKGKNI